MVIKSIFKLICKIFKGAWYEERTIISKQRWETNRETQATQMWVSGDLHPNAESLPPKTPCMPTGKYRCLRLYIT